MLRPIPLITLRGISFMAMYINQSNAARPVPPYTRNRRPFLFPKSLETRSRQNRPKPYKRKPLCLPPPASVSLTPGIALCTRRCGLKNALLSDDFWATVNQYERDLPGGEPTVEGELSNLLFAREYYDAIGADDGMMVSVCFCFVFSNAGIMVLVFAKFNRKCS